MQKTVEVVGAVIVRDHQILCAKRGASGSLPGLWEFPGGKIEAGESPQSALVREIQEELRVSILVKEEILRTRYEYPFATVGLTTFFCQLLEGEPKKSEHSELLWLNPEDLLTIEWAPADIPAVLQIQESF